MVVPWVAPEGVHSEAEQSEGRDAARQKRNKEFARIPSGRINIRFIMRSLKWYVISHLIDFFYFIPWVVTNIFCPYLCSPLE